MFNLGLFESVNAEFSYSVGFFSDLLNYYNHGNATCYIYIFTQCKNIYATSLPNYQYCFLEFSALFVFGDLKI